MAVGAAALRNKNKKKQLQKHPPIRHIPRYELPNGKSAWGGKAAGDKQKASDAHKRWVNVNKNKVEEDDVQSYHNDGEEEDERNFIGDSTAGGGQLEKSPDGKYRQTGVVNIVLYVGFGLVTLGLIITFVGIGEHGFKSPELRLIGPSLIGCGVLFCLLRLFFCSIPACCKVCIKGKPLDEKALLSPSRETLAEETTDTQNIPRPLQEEKDLQPHDRQVASKSAHTIRSTIPNYIEDECEDDEALGLNVEYIDETSMRQRLKGSQGDSRPSSSLSRTSTGSKLPRLPDIHSNGRRNTGSELVLNPATLQSAGD